MRDDIMRLLSRWGGLSTADGIDVEPPHQTTMTTTEIKTNLNNILEIVNERFDIDGEDKGKLNDNDYLQINNNVKAIFDNVEQLSKPISDTDDIPVVHISESLYTRIHRNYWRGGEHRRERLQEMAQLFWGNIRPSYISKKTMPMWFGFLSQHIYIETTPGHLSTLTENNDINVPTFRPRDYERLNSFIDHIRSFKNDHSLTAVDMYIVLFFRDCNTFQKQNAFYMIDSMLRNKDYVYQSLKWGITTGDDTLLKKAFSNNPPTQRNGNSYRLSVKHNCNGLVRTLLLDIRYRNLGCWIKHFGCGLRSWAKFRVWNEYQSTGMITKKQMRVLTNCSNYKVKTVSSQHPRTYKLYDVGGYDDIDIKFVYPNTVV